MKFFTQKQSAALNRCINASIAALGPLDLAVTAFLVDAAPANDSEPLYPVSKAAQDAVRQSIYELRRFAYQMEISPPSISLRPNPKKRKGKK